MFVVHGDHGPANLALDILRWKDTSDAGVEEYLRERQIVDECLVWHVRQLFSRIWHEDDNERWKGIERFGRAPALSVVVAVHGVERYLDECLQSLRDQTLADLEIIVVEDHSPDASLQIIVSHMLRDPRIVLVRTRRNRGLLLVRQAGARFARADYLTHVDGDDYLSCRIYEQALAAARAQDADIVQFMMWRDRQGVREPYVFSTPPARFLQGGKNILPQLLAGNMNYSMCNKLFRRSLWERCERYFPRRHFKIEDISRIPYLCYHAKVYVGLSEPGYFYRIHDDSGSRRMDLESVGLRAYSAARHAARLRRFLEHEGLLPRLLPVFGQFERQLYDGCVRKLVRRLRQGAEEELEHAPSLIDRREQALRDHETQTQGSETDFDPRALWWLRHVYRINGFLPLRTYMNARHPALPLIDPRLAAISHDEGPTVSVIVPVFNIATYLPRCLQSIAEQTFGDFEVIIVNDASTDDSGQVIDEWLRRDHRFRRVDHEENRGLLQARLSGVRVARGKYVVHVDGDDSLAPDMLEKMLRSAREHDSEVVQCGMRIDHPDGKVEWKSRMELKPKEGWQVFIDFLLPGGKIRNAVCTKMYRRELWYLCMRYFPRITYKAEDVALNTYLMAMASSFSHVGEGLYRYFLREDSGDRTLDPETIAWRCRSAVRNAQHIRYVASFSRNRAAAKAAETKINIYFRNNFSLARRLRHGHPATFMRIVAECSELADVAMFDTLTCHLTSGRRAAQVAPRQLTLYDRYLRPLEEWMVSKSTSGKKYDKYLNSPKAFFRDSRFFLLRWYGRLTHGK